MPGSGTLFTCPKYFRSYRVEIAAEYGGFQLKKINIEPGKNNAEFQSTSPAGALPALKSADGTLLFEASAIASFVGGSALSGGDGAVDRALVQQWCGFADQIILPACITWVMPCLGVSQYNKQATEKAKDEVKRVLELLNKNLSTRTWLVGERVTQADITVACNLFLLYTTVLDPSFRKPYDNVNRWFRTFVNQPQAKKVLGEVKLAEKMAQFDGKKYAELHGKGGDAGGKKQQPQKKEEKKPAAPAKKVEEEPPKPKEDKDPLAKLVGGNFVLDDFKRTYSNNDVKTVGIPYFWEHFDPANWSIWYCEYKYPEELRMLFMSANLVSGMFQRLDKLRKHGFGSMCIFGENHKTTISGVWFWRGQGLAFELSEDLQIDYESYDWKKLDPAAPDTKLVVQEYFSHEGNFGGKKLAEGKIFK